MICEHCNGEGTIETDNNGPIVDCPVCEKGTIVDKYRIEEGGFIVALRAGVWGAAGTVGGRVGNYDNLSQHGDCWVYDDAQVTGNARVHENARVSGSAQVYGDAHISGNAQIRDASIISERAQVYGNARVFENAWAHGLAQLSDSAQLSGHAYARWHCTAEWKRVGIWRSAPF